MALPTRTRPARCWRRYGTNGGYTPPAPTVEAFIGRLFDNDPPEHPAADLTWPRSLR